MARSHREAGSGTAAEPAGPIVEPDIVLTLKFASSSVAVNDVELGPTRLSNMKPDIGLGLKTSVSSKKLTKPSTESNADWKPAGAIRLVTVGPGVTATSSTGKSSPVVLEIL